MRRILTDIKLDKIAAVDAPAQEGARATIMKRRDDERPTITKSTWDQAVETLAKQERIPRTEAMRKFRLRNPQAWEQLQKSAPPRGNSRFEKLVAEDMRKGCTYEVAAQRAILKGARRDPVNDTVDDDWSGTGDADQAQTDFDAEVDKLMTQNGLKRTAAYQLVARNRPDLVQRMRG